MKGQDSTSPAHGQQVITVAAAIHRIVNGHHEILVARRAASKRFLPGALELPGGHLEFGESPEEGLQREVREELNTQIRIGSLIGAFTYANKIRSSHSIELIYLATLAENQAVLKPNPKDHSTIMWVSLNNIEQLLEINGSDDAEFPFIKLGLELLSGKALNLGD